MEKSGKKQRKNLKVILFVMDYGVVGTYSNYANFSSDHEYVVTFFIVYRNRWETTERSLVKYTYL